MKFGKFIGGGLGWALGGPIGGLLGFALGAAIDNVNLSAVEEKDAAFQTTRPGDFQISLLVLSAAVMKADGKVFRSELDYVRKFFLAQFGEETTKEAIGNLRHMLNQDIPVREVCMQIRRNMSHPLRLQLLHYLFGIAGADGYVDAVEVETIRRIATYLGVSHLDYESIKAMFLQGQAGGKTGAVNRSQSLAAAYKILEITEDVSDSEVKKAYRKMARKYHPDKVASLGEQHQKAAKEKFQKVQEAYEIVKETREMT